MKLNFVLFCLLMTSIGSIELNRKDKQQQLVATEMNKEQLKKNQEQVVPVVLLGVSAGLAAANCAMVFAEMIVHHGYLKSMSSHVQSFVKQWKTNVETFDVHTRRFQKRLDLFTHAMADLKVAANGKEIESPLFKMFARSSAGAANHSRPVIPRPSVNLFG